MTGFSTFIRPKILIHTHEYPDIYEFRYFLNSFRALSFNKQKNSQKLF